MKKKTITTLATIVTAAVIFIGSYITQDGDNNFKNGTSAQASDTQNRVSQSSVSQSSVSQSTKTQKNNSSFLTFPDTIVNAEKEGIVPFGYINATVTEVTDGDTLRIQYNNKEYKVRLLDIDTPESVKSGVDPQPFSKEASDLTKKTLSGEKVKLVFEEDTMDQYDRLLAYIILQDGTFYNAMMVQNGYAICVFYSPNTILKDYFTEIQNQAIKDNKGFWQLPESERPFIENSKGKFIASYKVKKEAA